MNTTQQKRRKQSRYWVFTINNPVERDTPAYNEETMDYLVYGKELGKDGTPHWQCFVVFKKKRRRHQIARIFNRAWIDAMYEYSTPPKASTYCKKEGSYVEHGTCPLSKSRLQSIKMKRKWEDVRTAAKEGNLDLVPADIYVRYYAAIKRIKQDHYVAPPDLEGVCGTWIHGPPGCGKTRYVKAMDNVYDKPLNKWWDNYHDEDIILLDDVDHAHKMWIGHYLKRWSDFGSFPAEQKGTTIWIRPKKIYVTSNYMIRDLFEDESLCEALERRYQQVDYEAYKELNK